MKKNKDIYALTGDLGFIGFDKIRDEFPDRFYNTGAAEQAMMDIAIGLAMSRKIPFVYSITPFLIYRPFEALRTYINHEQIPVQLVGSGRNDDYKHDGFSHHAFDVKAVLDTVPNINRYFPSSKREVGIDMGLMIGSHKPNFLSLSR
jgi:transketolase